MYIPIVCTNIPIAITNKKEHRDGEEGVMEGEGWPHRGAIASQGRGGG